MSSVSVVTNALRLRGFARPVSAEAILHPPLVERVREYAYLVAIALLAIGIGAASLYFARTDHFDYDRSETVLQREESNTSHQSNDHADEAR